MREVDETAAPHIDAIDPHGPLIPLQAAGGILAPPRHIDPVVLVSNGKYRRLAIGQQKSLVDQHLVHGLVTARIVAHAQGLLRKLPPTVVRVVADAML